MKCESSDISGINRCNYFSGKKKIGVSILVYIVVWCNDHQWEWVYSSNSTKCQKIV